MDDEQNFATASELRFVLNVMEENSHLGLDDGMADRMRRILIRRINQAERARHPKPSCSVPVDFDEMEMYA